VGDVIKLYTDSYETLQRIGKEAAFFLEAVCRAHVRINDFAAQRPEKLKGAAKKEAKQLTKLISITPITTSPSLQAELTSETPEYAFELLEGSLQVATEKVVESFLESLQRLHENGVVGVIEFPVEGACRFRFYETHVDEGTVNTKVKRSRTRRFRRTTTTTTGRVDLSHHEREHQLAFATRHGLPHYEELIPKRIRTMLETVPLWLHPEIEIVDGDLFREQSRKRHKRTEEWTERHVQQTRIRYDPDPAATLGTFVLGAWKTDEADLEKRDIEIAEQDRDHHHATQQREDARAGWRQVKRAALLQLIPLGIHGLALGLGPWAHGLAVIVSIALLWQLLPALKHFALAGDVNPNTNYYVLSLAVAIFGLLAIHAAVFLLATGSLPAIGGLILSLVAAGYFGREWNKYYHLPPV